MTDALYSYWHRALAVTNGERALTRDEMQSLGLTHEVGAGFFLKRQRYTRLVRDDTWAASAIWPSEGAMVAYTRKPSPLVAVPADDLWIWCSGYPITEERWKALTNGRMEP